MYDQEELKRLFTYGPKTGNFYRKTSPCNSVQVGDVAGTKTRDDGYTYIRFRGRPVAAQRLAWLFMYGEWPAERVDHKDRDRANNAISNLRLATSSQNQYNRKLCTKSTTGVKGVGLHKASGKYQVTLAIDGVKRHFGLFPDLETADLVARGAREKYHGEHHRHD